MPIFAVDERASLCCESQRERYVQHARAFSYDCKACALAISQCVFPISIERKHARADHFHDFSQWKPAYTGYADFAIEPRRHRHQESLSGRRMARVLGVCMARRALHNDAEIIIEATWFE